MSKRINHEEARKARLLAWAVRPYPEAIEEVAQDIHDYIAQQERQEPDGWISGWVDPTPNNEGVFRGYFGERAVGMPGLRRAAVRYIDGGTDE